MPHSGRVMQVGLVSEAQTGHPAMELWTDSAEDESSVLIYVQTPAPTVGDLIEWGPHHVDWHRADGSVTRLHKLGWAIDPDAALL
jgi:hypothetical protein